MYRSIVNDWRNHVCNHLLVYSFTNHATTNDGAVHHATSAVMNYLFAERLNIEPMTVASMVLFGNFFSVLTLPLLLSYTLSLA